MKRIIYFLFLVMVLTSCEFTPITKPNVPTNSDPATTEPSTIDWDQIKFENQTIDYDGELHKIEVSGLPEGAEVSYFPSSRQRFPGEYEYRATVKIDGEEKEFYATLTINKLSVELYAETEQIAYLTDGAASAKYSSNLDSNDVSVIQPTFTKPGVYEVVLSTVETPIYCASNEIVVTLTVKESRSGLYLPSETLISDGINSVTTEVSSYGEANVDDYTIVYNNCSHTSQGVYQASAEVYEKNSGEYLETLKAIMTVDYASDSEFSAYADDMFIYLFGGDQMSTNIFFINPENYGIEHSDAIYYTYEPFTEDEWNNDKAEIERLFEELATFDDNMLSFSQLSTKQVIYETLVNYQNVYNDINSFFMDMRYVDQYGGYCANFPTYLEAYSLRNEQDIKDVISYIESAYDAFMSYIVYIEDREEHGYGYSIFTLEKMQEYLDGVVENSDAVAEEGDLYGMVEPEDYYLYPILSQKIADAGDALTLSSDTIASYQTALYNAFKEQYIPAHHDLSAAIEDYLAVATSEGGYLEQVDGKYVSFVEGYIPNYAGGKDYYEKMLKDTLGVYDLSMEEIIAYLDKAFADSYKEFVKYAKKVGKFEDMIINGSVEVFGTDDPVEILKELKKFAATIVPELAGDPTIDVAYMDETITANTTTLAYYMKSPIDGTLNEYIHLNGDAIGKNKLDTALTLAHEGYPGHLYAYVYTKEDADLHNINRVFTCTGHAEGWAKYVEYALANYLAEMKGTDAWEIAMNYNNYYSIFAYTMQTRLDIGVNYEGWTVKDVESYLTVNKLNAEIAEDIYYSCIEAPSQIATYGYGMARFVDYHNEAKAVLGDYYDEVEFNAMLLSNGWCSLSTLDKMVNDFINNKCYVNNIDYVA